jgi:hypothetical protein
MCGCSTQTVNDNAPALSMMQQGENSLYSITKYSEPNANKIGQWFSENAFLGGTLLVGAIAAVTYKINTSKKGEL